MTVPLIDLRGELLRRAWISLACLVAVPGAVYVYSRAQPRVHQATAVVELQPEKRAPGAGGLPTDLQLRPALVAVYADTGRAVAATAKELGRPLSSVGALIGDYEPRTGWVALKATSGSAALSIEAANAFAEGLDLVMRSVWRERRDDLIRVLRQARIASTDPAKRAEATAQLRQLRGARLGGPALRVVEPAASTLVVSPHPERNALLAGVLALLLAPALILVAERLDRRVRRIDDLERLYGSDALAAMPPTDSTGERSAEAFRRVREQLLRSDAFARAGEVLVVVDPLDAEDSITVAVGLADAFASAGLDAVLVDADMHRSGIAATLGMPDRPGLADVLGGLTPAAALRDVTRGGGRLRIMAAGIAGSRGADLLGSRGPAVLDDLERECDLLILHAPPLLRSSGALPLLARASGVVAVARLNDTPRDAVRRAAALFSNSGARLRGVVVIEPSGHRRARHPRRRLGKTPATHSTAPVS